MVLRLVQWNFGQIDGVIGVNGSDLGASTYLWSFTGLTTHRSSLWMCEISELRCTSSTQINVGYTYIQYRLKEKSIMGASISVGDPVNRGGGDEDRRGLTPRGGGKHPNRLQFPLVFVSTPFFSLNI